MKKMIKKTSALAISAFMVAQTLPFSVFAAGGNTLKIHPYIVDAATKTALKAPNDSATGKPADEDRAKAKGTANTTMTFNVVEVNSDGSAKSGGYSSTAAGTTFTDLPDGYFKITPVNNDTDNNFRDAEAFIIQLPVPDGSSILRTVDIYPKFTNNNETTDPETPGQETPATGDTHNVTLTKTKAGSTDAVAGATYKIYYKDAAGNWVAGSSTYTTGANGKIVVDGLPLGEYYFVEQTAPTGYLLDQTPIKFTIDGTAAATATATNDSTLKVKKNIDNDGAGENYNWTITADVPSKTANLLSYTVTDKYTGLSSTAGDITVAIDGMTETTDYTVDKATAGTITINLTAAGIEKLAGKTSFNIKVGTKLAASATEATNAASISYKYAYNPDDTDPTPNIPDIPDPDHPDDPDNPYPDPTNYPDSGVTPDPTDPDSPVDKVTPGTFTISNVNGEEELAGASYKITSENGTEVATVADSPDVATVEKLAPGHYKIRQTAVDDGHLLNDEVKDIYVGKDGYIYSDPECQNKIVNDKGTTDTTDDTPNQVKFYNQPKGSFDLPFTGTTATIVFSITGILLMAGTAFFIFIILKKKDEEEEEKENS